MLQIVQLYQSTAYFIAKGVNYKRIQYPIINAFALTIHKIQGLDLPSLTMTLNRNIFSDGQAYIRLSRCYTLEQLFLSHLDWDAIKADPEATAEYECLEAKAVELQS